MTIADDLARLEEIVRKLEADDVESRRRPAAVRGRSRPAPLGPRPGTVG